MAVITTPTTVSVADDGTSPIGSNEWNSVMSCIRPRLTASADHIYYVRTDGSDSNTGLANTAAGAFRTINYAIRVVGSIDFSSSIRTTNTYDARAQIFVADGTYNEDLILPILVGGYVGDYNNYAMAEVIGNTSTPGNVIVNGGIGCNGSNQWLIAGMRFVAPIGAFVTENGILRTYSVEYDCNKAILIYDQSHYYSIFGLTFIGSHDTCIEIKHGSYFLQHSAGTINTSGAGSYGTAFCTMIHNSQFESVGTISNSGSHTGVRFIIDSGSVVETAANTLTDMPGDTAGLLRGGATYNGRMGFDYALNDGIYSTKGDPRILVGSTATDAVDGWNDVVKVDLGASGTYPGILYKTTNAGVQGVAHVNYHASASPSSGDRIGEEWWYGHDSGGFLIFYANEWVEIINSTSGNCSSKRVFGTITNNQLDASMLMGAGVLVSTAHDSGTLLPGKGNLAASGFVKTGAVTVGGLPAASTANVGARYVVTDATTTTFATTVVGGSTCSVPVYSDGTNWRIG